MQRIKVRPRRNWRGAAEAVGFTYHHLDDRLYWDERAYYAFTLDEVEGHLEPAAETLHAMCLDLVAEAAVKQEVMERLAIPEASRDEIARSWRQQEPSLYGRFDFAYDGAGPAKLYEYNADTPTSLFESAVFQWLWLEARIADGTLPPGADQFNGLHEALIARFKTIFPEGGFVHFASDPDAVEDRQTVRYLEDLATQAGLEPKFTSMQAIGLNAEGLFLDIDNDLIQAIFKLYPWEQMLREPYAANLATAKTQFLEPAWKAVLSNKAILPLLWDRHTGHPNLLEAYFDDDPRIAQLGSSYVRKPIFSREGGNIELVDHGRHAQVLDQGYGSEGWIRQALCPPPRFDGHYPVIGAWMVGDQPAGIGIREDRSRVTKNFSRFVPHAIIG